MADITLAQAQAHLGAWLAADLALATAEEYYIGDRRLRRADLGDVQRAIAYWRGEVSRLTAVRGRGARLIRAVPRDL